MGIGWTIGEEILYGTTNRRSILRHETCHSVDESCLLQITVDDLVTMSSQKAAIGGGGFLVQDYEILLSFLEKNYDVKNSWRREQGLATNSQIDE